MKYCSNCNRHIEDDAQLFCAKCGAPLVEKNVCPNCHTENELDFAFCKKCGAKLNGNRLEDSVSTQTSLSTQTNAGGTLKETSHINWGRIISCIILILGVFLALNKDSINLYLKYNDAKSALEKGYYVAAANEFSALGDYKDSKALMYSSMASYVNRNMDMRRARLDYNIRRFMKELKNNSPANFDWDAKYKAIFGWKVEIINMSKVREDYFAESDSRTFTRGGPYYLHFRVIGGEPNELTKIRYTIVTESSKYPTARLSETYHNLLADGMFGEITLGRVLSDAMVVTFFNDKGRIGQARFYAEE